MARRLMRAVPILLAISTTFFSYGCTVSQRKELLDEAKLYAAEQIKAALPGLKDELAKVSQAKLDQMEISQKAALDQQLLSIADKGDDGVIVHKTWKDFDTDGDGHLSPTELAKVSTYIVSQVSKGHADKGALKGGAGAIGALLALYLGRRGANKLLGGSTAAPPPSGQPPSTTGVPTPPASSVGGTTP
jgi:hypothetical protein